MSRKVAGRREHVFKYYMYKLQSAKLMQDMNPSVWIAVMHDSSIKTWA